MTAANATPSFSDRLQGMVIRCVDGMKIELVRAGGACVVRPLDDDMGAIAVLLADDSQAEQYEAAFLTACTIFGRCDARPVDFADAGDLDERECWPKCSAADVQRILAEMLRLASAGDRDAGH